MKFRPCIDLRNGKVVQIVGGTLSDDEENALRTNFTAGRPPDYFAGLYRKDRLSGGHVIMLGPGNTDAAIRALAAYPGGLQAGGGVTPENAASFLDAGASHVIVTSYLFTSGRLDMDKLGYFSRKIGKEKIVLDLSCRKKAGEYRVVADRWQTFTKEAVTAKTLEKLSLYCDEFLVHGVDVEGRMQGIETDLVRLLGAFSPIPSTYAGGVSSFEDIKTIETAGAGRVDFTIGSALDIFGGHMEYRRVAAGSTP